MRLSDGDIEGMRFVYGGVVFHMVL